jgi:thiaminase/transcriptional activator TenA
VTAPLSVQLRESVAEVWEAQHRHPFVTSIGDGTLDVERFKVWLRQDWLFLTEYARMLALGAARAPDLATMTRFAGLARATLEDEMSLHRSYAEQFGISESELDAEQMLPTTQGYTDFLVRTASQGDFAELVAALLPCMWGYSELGLRLAERVRPADERYADWIEMYASDEFAELAAWCRDLTDRIEGGDRERMGRAFATSSRYELAFWEMAWSGESWPA